MTKTQEQQHWNLKSCVGGWNQNNRIAYSFKKDSRGFNGYDWEKQKK